MVYALQVDGSGYFFLQVDSKIAIIQISHQNKQINKNKHIPDFKFPDLSELSAARILPPHFPPLLRLIGPLLTRNPPPIAAPANPRGRAIPHLLEATLQINLEPALFVIDDAEPFPSPGILCRGGVEVAGGPHFGGGGAVDCGAAEAEEGRASAPDLLVGSQVEVVWVRVRVVLVEEVEVGGPGGNSHGCVVVFVGSAGDEEGEALSVAGRGRGEEASSFYCQ